MKSPPTQRGKDEKKRKDISEDALATIGFFVVLLIFAAAIAFAFSFSMGLALKLLGI